MRDLKTELKLMDEKNPPLRTNFDYRAMVIRAQMAEAEVSKLKEATVDMRNKVLLERNRREKAEAEVERLRGEVTSLTVANCRLIKISLYDGLGKPELIDGKCFGYGGNMDEPHIDCQYCKAFYWREEE